MATTSASIPVIPAYGDVEAEVLNMTQEDLSDLIYEQFTKGELASMVTNYMKVAKELKSELEKIQGGLRNNK